MPIYWQRFFYFTFQDFSGVLLTSRKTRIFPKTYQFALAHRKPLYIPRKIISLQIPKKFNTIQIPKTPRTTPIRKGLIGPINLFSPHTHVLCYRATRILYLYRHMYEKSRYDGAAKETLNPISVTAHDTYLPRSKSPPILFRERAPVISLRKYYTKSAAYSRGSLWTTPQGTMAVCIYIEKVYKYRLLVEHPNIFIGYLARPSAALGESSPHNGTYTGENIEDDGEN